jgi:hypothetical protein
MQLNTASLHEVLPEVWSKTLTLKENEMNVNRLLSFFLVIFGEILIICCFLYFGKDVQSEILTLNIVVSTLIYCLVFFDVIFPWINLKDKSQKQVGSIGIRWVVTTLYLIFGIGTMVLLNTVVPVVFAIQVLIHCFLLFFMLVGIFLSVSASEKVKEIYVEESQNRNRIEEMKRITKEVQHNLEAGGQFPAEMVARINELYINLRYLSPSSNEEALKLEKKFVDGMRSVNNYLDLIPPDVNRIVDEVNRLERIYKERKQVYSN